MSGRRQAGFTLLEMLVALVVFGLLMAGLSQTLRYGFTAWTAARHGAAGPAELAMTDGGLRRLLEQAAPLGFSGAADHLAFTTTLPEGSGLNGRLADVALLLGPGGRLVLRWRAHLDGLPLSPPPPPRENTLLSGVRSLRFSYLSGASGSPVWTDHFVADNLPLLVRLNIGFMGSRQWPDLVAAPAATPP